MPTDSRASIKQAYDEGMAAVFLVVGSLDSTKAQKKVARQTAADLTAMLVANTLETIEGRTAILAGLIVELNEVIAAVQATPSLQGPLEQLTRVLDKAHGLYAKEKKLLV